MSNPPMLRNQALLALSVPAIAILGACGPSGGSSSSAPDADVDGVSAVFDCDDNDPDVSGRQIYFVDEDGDGMGGSQSVSLCSASAPTGYSDIDGDCDDTNPDVSGGAAYFADRDSDGHGAGPAIFLCTSTPPPGMVTNSDDPNDADAGIVPQDADGDGYSNSNDCARNDPDAYALNRYYKDEDGDGRGSGEVEICGPLPAPSLSGHVSNDLDRCPQVFDSGRDFDEDGIDDVCDALIHVRRSRTLTEDVEFPDRLAATDTKIEYRVGDDGSPVELRFEGATLLLDDCVSVRVRGGSALVFETLHSGDYAALELGSPQGHSSRCQTSIRGENASNASRRNRVQFFAARLLAGSRARFLDLNEVVFTSARIRNDHNAQVEHGSDLFLETPSGRNWSADEYLTFAGFSRGDAAVVVEDQFLDLTDVRFIGNDGYPLECIGRDYRLLPGTATHRTRTSRTTCQTAISRSHFDGNRRSGPLLTTLEEYDSDTGVANLFDRRRNFFSILFGDPGTDTIYVRQMIFGNESSTNYSVRFNDLDVLPYVTPLSSGDEISEDVEIRIGVTTGPGPTVAISNSDIRDVPIVVLGEARLDVRGSRLGPMRIETDAGPSNSNGPEIDIEDSELDFEGSEFRQYVLFPDRVGDTLTAGIVFDNFGNRTPGTLDIRDSKIELNEDIDHGILFLSSRDPEDSISIDRDSLPNKTDFDELVRDEANDCCAITPYFGLK